VSRSDQILKLKLVNCTTSSNYFLHYW